MTPQAEETARRLVQWEGWRWMPRMLTADEWTICDCDPCVPGAGLVSMYGTQTDGPKFTSRGLVVQRIAGHIPDLDDPATVGCIAALVRERHPAASVSMMMNDEWIAWRIACDAPSTHATAGEAWAALALET